MCATMIGHAKLATWVSTEVKARFHRLADREGLTDSAKLKLLINDCLVAADGPPAPRYPRLNGALGRPKGERLSLRLQAADRLLLKERASARGLREATYLAMLVRAHVRALTPLPTQELRALQSTVAELRAIGRNLNQIARSVNEGRAKDRTLLVDAVTLIPVCERVRDHVKAFIKTNLMSWESGREQAHR
jgi:hypothetical protein